MMLMIFRFLSTILFLLVRKSQVRILILTPSLTSRCCIINPVSEKYNEPAELRANSFGLPMATLFTPQMASTRSLDNSKMFSFITEGFKTNFSIYRFGILPLCCRR